MNRPDLDREVDLDDLGIAMVRAVVGDRTGAALFLVAILFFGLIWRVGFFSTDNYALANALVAVSDGHLSVDRILYGPSDGDTPGMHLVDGRLYARNYGMVFAALLFFGALRSISLVADPRVFLAGAWCLGVLGLVVLVGERVDRGREARFAGAALAFGLFVGNAAIATPLSLRWYPVMALQFVTATAAALTAVFVYRLLVRVHGYRVGVFGGGVTALASPVAFWATIPKRHAVTAALAVVAAYGLYRARTEPTPGGALRFRALSYVPVALTAWVHAAEALVLLVALGSVDLLSARSNHPRRLAVVAVVFLIALAPFLATNVAIAGNPLEPPRLLADYGGTGADLGGAGGGASGTTPTDPADAGSGGSAGRSADGGGASAESGGTPAGGGGSGDTPPTGSLPLAGVVSGLGALAAAAIARLERLVGYLDASMSVWTDPRRLTEVFVRSGYVERSPSYDFKAINLSVLESMPVLGALVGTPLLARRREGRFEFDPARTVDAFVVVYLVVLATLYLSRLPIHHMLTVRYLHPIYPLGVYLVARYPPVRRVVTDQWSPLLVSYAVTVVAGSIAYVAAIAAVDAVLSEAVQLFALVSVGIALVVGAWSVRSVVRPGRDRLGPLLLGAATGAVTVYLLVSGLAFFVYTDEFLLPGSRLLAEHLTFVNPLRSLWAA